jgi:hypothetical protein
VYVNRNPKTHAGGEPVATLNGDQSTKGVTLFRSPQHLHEPIRPAVTLLNLSR